MYVLDTSFFLTAYKHTYPMDVFPAFWDKLSALAHDGIICSIDKVKKELYGAKDALEQWCEDTLPADFFKTTNEQAVITAYRRVATWANGQREHYKSYAIDEFLGADNADAFLVAYGLAMPQPCILVTQEVLQRERRNKIKIPNACLAFGLTYMDTISLLRRLKVAF